MRSFLCFMGLWIAAVTWGGSLSLSSENGAHAVVDGAKPHVSSSSESIFFTKWGYGTYTLTASPGSPYVFVADATTISAGEPNGTNSVKKTIENTNTAAENFSLGLRGKMYIPGSEEGSPIDWSASINTKFFYIQSNQSGGAKVITVPAGTSVTYTAKEGTSTVSSDWKVNGEPKNNVSSIIFSRSWWDVPGWFDASMGTPKPGIYAISASPTGKITPSDSGEMKVVGVVSISGHGKTSTREQTPSGTDKWTDSETIYAQPQSVVVLSMALFPNVTLTDALKESISWSVSGLFSTITPNNSNRLEATFKPGSSGDYVIMASCGASRRVIRVKAVAPKIYSVTFGGDITIKKDTGGNYSGVAWQDDDLDGVSDLNNANADSSKKYQPIAYRSTATMSATAVFKPNCRNSSDTDFISAYDVEAAVKKVRFTPYSFWSLGNNWSTPVGLHMGGTAVTAASAFSSSPKVGYDGSFELAWEVGFGEAGTADSGLAWERSYSEHELYLTYAAMVSPATDPAFETVLHISCTNANGSTNGSQIVSNIWSGFRTLDVKRKDNTQLTYYRSYLTTVVRVGDLLAGTDGQCGSWANFLQTALGTHGISSEYIRFYPQPTVGEGFIVKTWSFSGSGTSGDADFSYINAYPSSGTIWGSTQYNWGAPEEVSYTSGTEGQNNPKPASFFNNHQIIRYNGVYYDPSYGITHASLQSIDDSLSGFFKQTSSSFLFKKNPPGTQITI